MLRCIGCKIRYGLYALSFATRPLRLRLVPSRFSQPLNRLNRRFFMVKTLEQVRPDLPHLIGPLPGARARAIIERDAQVVSTSYTRGYPLVVCRGEGAMVEDVDGNRFLDFNAGIAVVATGHCHPRVVEAIREQAGNLIHMSGTDFYYEALVDLAEKLGSLAPGGVERRVSFCNSGA